MNINRDLADFFTEKLLLWHELDNERKHPWSADKNPYKIWLSEIIMQQTRIEQGLPYYLRFVEKYPTIKDLAAAKDEAVFLLWQGLGYYNRCKNLLHTARFIEQKLDGKFPQEYEQILALKGVGNYTAAAIASFAYDLPFAVLDGNVFRLLARFFGLEEAIDNNKGKKNFQSVAQQLLPENAAADYNQAVMDFGATVCTPKTPDCAHCPLSGKCFAFKKDCVAELPFKEKKLKVLTRHFHYFVLQIGQEIFIRQRTDKDIWQHLFEFFLVETKDATIKPTDWRFLKPYLSEKKMAVLQTRQRLTHQLILAQFHLFVLKQKPAELPDGKWIAISQLPDYAFPKTILLFLKNRI